MRYLTVAAFLLIAACVAHHQTKRACDIECEKALAEQLKRDMKGE